MGAPDLEDAFRSEATALLGYFMRRVTPQEDAADLLSETFLAAWKSPSLGSIEPVGIRPWLYGIAANVLRQHRRGKGRRTALGDKLRANVVADLAAGLDGVVPGVDPDLAEHIRDIVSTLPELDREIITLVYWEGFTQEEVAAILGKRAVTVRSRLSRTRAVLRERLAAAQD
ncbi:RNA polymerase sigma factor [Microbacterium sp. NPDC057741]